MFSGLHNAEVGNLVPAMSATSAFPEKSIGCAVVGMDTLEHIAFEI